MRHVEKQRIRWLTIGEANRLLKELPSHLKDMADFSLSTGLRASNVRLYPKKGGILIKLV
ncbi:phage integrase [Legionella santicrucis]|uniref:Phage integrase n=1 Tax=Legionella santicrucis TaxID=45074 RepID=A0A0W0Z3P5_9GAMM|nr:phage integrase [Legionella santicrucis]